MTVFGAEATAGVSGKFGCDATEHLFGISATLTVCHTAAH
jgi:hypothetical protein